MNVDFALVLVVLTAGSGLIWLYDACVAVPRRRRRTVGTGPAARPAQVATVPKQPVLAEYAASFFPIFLIVLLLRSFLVEPFRIPSGSMMPTLLVGDFILVNKYEYGIRLPVTNAKIVEVNEPQRGDIVVFRYPVNPSVPFIKRIVGVPGDHVAYRDRVLYVNGVAAGQEPAGTFIGVGGGAVETGDDLRVETLGALEHNILVNPRKPSVREGDLVIPAGQYFVMGDNRDNSMDSRFWGTVPEANLIGKAFVIWMNWDIKNGGIDFKRLGRRVQ